MSRTILAPVQQAPWGVIADLRGPLPLAMRQPAAASLRRANMMLHNAMITLERNRVGRPEAARRVHYQCNRALDLLLAEASAPPWRMAYAFDRVGLLAQLQDRQDEAETWYLRSLGLLHMGTWPPTAWNAITCYNLAVLYDGQGKWDLGLSLVAYARTLPRSYRPAGSVRAHARAPFDPNRSLFSQVFGDTEAPRRPG